MSTQIPPGRGRGRGRGRGDGEDGRRLRKKRKTSEKTIPEKLLAAIPESEMFAKLLAFEQEIDMVLQRRRFELHEDLRRPSQKEQKLRVWVYHEFKEAHGAEPASWTLKLVGKLLGSEELHWRSGLNKKFSSFVKTMHVLLTTQGSEAGPEIVEWSKPAGFEEVDGLEIKRVGTRTVETQILIHLDCCPERFQLSQQLADVLQLNVNNQESRTKVLEALWHYIKVMNLQDSSNSAQILCDQKLKKLFGCDKADISSLLKRLDEHMSPSPPVTIHHTIRLPLYGSDPAELDQCYDVDVLVNDPAPGADFERFFVATPKDSERKYKIDSLNEEILRVANTIKEHQSKREFYQSLHHAPYEFLNELIATQALDDQKKAKQKAGTVEESHSTSHFHKPWISEAVHRYLVMQSLSQHGNQF